MKILAVKPPRLLWEKDIQIFLDRLSEFSPETAILIGWCGFSTSLIKELKERRYFLVTSPYDDIAITKEARKYDVLLDGRIVKVKNIIIGGVGGLNPIQDMSRLSRILKPGIILHILVSYHPPYKCGDLVSSLGIRRGLHELTEVLREVKPRLLVASGSTFEICKFGRTKALTLGERTNSVVLTYHNSSIDVSNFLRLP